MKPADRILHKGRSLADKARLALQLRDRRTVLLLGTPDYKNIGDSAIAMAEKLFLENCGYRVLEFTAQEAIRNRDMLRALFHPHGLVTLQGGGNMGDLWPREEEVRQDLIRAFRVHPIIIFPQTVYYRDPERAAASVPVYESAGQLWIMAREETSLAIMKKLYPRTRVVLTPDMVLSLDPSHLALSCAERHGVLFCMRDDEEKAVSSAALQRLEKAVSISEPEIRTTDMIAADWITKSGRSACVRNKMEEFRCSRYVITDRLHGMIFAAISETPCLVMSNNHHKIAASFQWLKDLDYIFFASDPQQAQQLLPKLRERAGKPCRYDASPIMPKCHCLEEILRQKGEL